MKPSVVTRLILDLEQEIGWETGVILRGISVTRKDGNFLMTVKVIDRKHKARVAFIEGHTIRICYALLAGAVYTNAIHLKWNIDKYYNP